MSKKSPSQQLRHGVPSQMLHQLITSQAPSTAIRDSGNSSDRSRNLTTDALPAPWLPRLSFLFFASPNLNWHPHRQRASRSAVCERVSFPSLLRDRLWQVGGWWSDGDVRRPRPLWCWVAVALEAPSAQKRSVARGRFSWTVSASQLPSAHPPTHPHTHPQSQTLRAHAFIVSPKMLMDPFVNWLDFISCVLQATH